MKLACMKCGREIGVRARDVEEAGVTVEQWDISNPEDLAEDRLGCPFCWRSRGGFYPLERAAKREAP